MVTSRVLLALLFVSAVVLVISCSDHGTCPPPTDHRRYASRVMRDYQYLDMTYFDLVAHDTSIAVSPLDLQPGDSITNLELYYSVNTSSNIPGIVDARRCSLYVDPFDKARFPNETFAASVLPYMHDPVYPGGGTFSYNPTSHYITMDRPVPVTWLGAHIQFQRRNQDGSILSGEIGSIKDSVYTLKLIACANPQPMYVTWNYVWRNVYSLGCRIDDPDNLQVTIYIGDAINTTERNPLDSDNQQGKTFINLLGLDNDNNGQIDSRNEQIVDRARGHIRFPSREPFADPELDVRVDTLYHTNSPQVRANATKYYLLVRMPAE
jgi:hypothetical protein